MEEYIATARMEDGRTLQAKGTIIACAQWCDNVLRANQCGAEIQIQKTGGVAER